MQTRDPLLLSHLVKALGLPGWEVGCEDQVSDDFVLDQKNGLYRCFVEKEVVFSTPDGLTLALVIAGQVQQKVARLSQWIFVHAGAVATEAGVILFPGKSFSGKSTLVCGLVQAGAAYYSDEFAILDPASDLVTAFPRRLVLRQGPLAGEIGGTMVAPPERPVTAVFALKYEESGWNVSPCSPGAAALHLFQNTVAARRLGPTALDCFARIAASTRNFQGIRGEAGAAAGQILRLSS